VRIEPFRMERMQSTYENYVEYNLSESGVQPMAPSEVLGDGAEREAFLAAGLGYVQSNGSEMLRDRIASFYDGAGRDNVLVTNGGSEANYTTFWTLLERGDRVAYMLPNYLQTWGLARAWAGRADAFRLAAMDDGRGGRRWGLDVAALDRAVTRKTKIVLVTNPNNPTGAVLTGDEMDAVVRAARRAGAYIVADEIYRGAEMEGPTTPSFWGRYDRVIITSGLSKAFGMPGLRIGWIAGPSKVVAKIWSYRDYTTIAPGMLSDLLARRVMEPARRAAIFERTRAIMRRNWPVLAGFVDAHRGVLTVIPPRAGAIAFLRYDLPIGSLALCERLRTEKSVLIVPGDQVGVPRHIRIGFGYGADHRYLLAGLERIGALVGELSAGARRTPKRPVATRPARARRAAAPRAGRARPSAARRGDRDRHDGGRGPARFEEQVGERGVAVHRRRRDREAVRAEEPDPLRAGPVVEALAPRAAQDGPQPLGRPGDEEARPGRGVGLAHQEQAAAAQGGGHATDEPLLRRGVEVVQDVEQQHDVGVRGRVGRQVGDLDARGVAQSGARHARGRGADLDADELHRRRVARRGAGPADPVGQRQDKAAPAAEIEDAPPAVRLEA